MSTITVTVPDNNPALLLEAAEFLKRCSGHVGLTASAGAHLVNVIADVEQEAEAMAEAGGVVAPPPVTEPDEGDDTTDDAELDSAGLPWDGRIHSSGRTKLKSDGTWKKKKGIDQSVVDAVEAELRGASITPTPTPTPGVQTVSAGELVPPPGAVEAINQAPETVYMVEGNEFTESALREANWTDEQLATLPKKSVGPAATPVPAADAVTTFPQLLKVWQSATPEQQQAALTKHGLASVALVATKPDIIPVIAADLQA